MGLHRWVSRGIDQGFPAEPYELSREACECGRIDASTPLTPQRTDTIFSVRRNTMPDTRCVVGGGKFLPPGSPHLKEIRRKFRCPNPQYNQAMALRQNGKYVQVRFAQTTQTYSSSPRHRTRNCQTPTTPRSTSSMDSNFGPIRRKRSAGWSKRSRDWLPHHAGQERRLSLSVP